MCVRVCGRRAEGGDAGGRPKRTTYHSRQDRCIKTTSSSTSILPPPLPTPPPPPPPLPLSVQARPDASTTSSSMTAGTLSTCPDMGERGGAMGRLVDLPGYGWGREEGG